MDQEREDAETPKAAILVLPNAHFLLLLGWTIFFIRRITRRKQKVA